MILQLWVQRAIGSFKSCDAVCQEVPAVTVKVHQRVRFLLLHEEVLGPEDDLARKRANNKTTCKYADVTVGTLVCTIPPHPCIIPA